MLEIPTAPLDADPIELYRGRSLDELQALLDAALHGVELGTYDVRIIEWAKKAWDQPTLIAVASLIERARQHGAELRRERPEVTDTSVSENG